MTHDLSAAIVESQRRTAAQMARHGILAGAHQTWREGSTGRDFVLLGRKTNSWVMAPAGAEVRADNVRHVDLDVLNEAFTYVSCDHEQACCPTHQSHTSPHVGCVLR